VLAWHFPVRENYWHYKDAGIRGRKLTNYYGTRFKSAWDVATHTASRLSELESKTRLFTDTFFSSTLPPEVLEAVSSQASILRTNTCILLEGRQFFGFEGCGDDEANGWMNCSHVWNYEHAVAFLFPELERSMRDTDFLHELRSDDSLAFRAAVPLVQTNLRAPIANCLASHQTCGSGSRASASRSRFSPREIIHFTARPNVPRASHGGITC